MKLTLLFFLAFLPLTLLSQNCDCKSTLDWAKNVFEENDAGYTTVMDVAGKPQAYKIHNTMFEEKVASISNINECARTIDEWMRFFRSGHLGFAVSPSVVDNRPNEETQERESIKEDNWKKIDFDLEELNTYFSKKGVADFEGVWVSGPYEIGIRKIGTEYVGFIIDPGSSSWQKGEVKLTIKEDGSAVYYMGDYSAEAIENTELWEADHLIMDFISLKRKFSSSSSSSNSIVDQYFEAIEATEPYFRKLDDSTAYIRIPSFKPSEKSKIDSLLKLHHLAILNSPNLLIDIRNNGGGGDASYEELIPYLYTNPIRKIGVEYLATAYNKQMWLDFANNEGFIKELYGGEDWPIDMQKECEGIYKKLSAYDGGYVSLDDSAISETVLDSIYPYPENVGVIINNYVGSTAEQFVLEAKQSMKVKLFGTTTAGALDMSNLNFIESPCGKYYIKFASSRSKRLPENRIDDIGIQPDYFLDGGIPKYKWTEYVTRMFNEGSK